MRARDPCHDVQVTSAPAFFSALIGLLTTVNLFSGVVLAQDAAKVAEEDRGSESEAADEAARELARLRALGYVDFSPEAATAERSGVTRHEVGRSYPGYNLYTIRPLARAELIDNLGNLVHSWSESPANPWKRSVLLDNGDLLVVTGKTPNAHAMRLNWNGDVLWRLPLKAHHDIGVAPDGRLVALTHQDRIVPELHDTVPLRDNRVALFDPASGEIESLSLFDVLIASSQVLPRKRSELLEGIYDPIHANSVRFMTRKELVGRHPIYDLGHLLVCMRNQDAIAVLDWKRKQFIWAWGADELEAPHDARVLENGNVLLFDNGGRRGWSRVIEMDPRTGQIVWEYKADPPEDFLTESRGGAQRLPNGNTLITESNDGRGFEVTPQGEIVWEYYVAGMDDQGTRPVIIRLYRYEASVVEPLLEKFGGRP